LDVLDNGAERHVVAVLVGEQGETHPA
jgi:hypothetical protein